MEFLWSVIKSKSALCHFKEQDEGKQQEGKENKGDFSMAS